MEGTVKLWHKAFFKSSFVQRFARLDGFSLAVGEKADAKKFTVYDLRLCVRVVDIVRHPSPLFTLPSHWGIQSSSLTFLTRISNPSQGRQGIDHDPGDFEIVLLDIPSPAVGTSPARTPSARDKTISLLLRADSESEKDHWLVLLSAFDGACALPIGESIPIPAVVATAITRCLDYLQDNGTPLQESVCLHCQHSRQPLTVPFFSPTLLPLSRRYP
jgi:hypothetical protein